MTYKNSVMFLMKMTHLLFKFGCILYVGLLMYIYTI